MNDRPVMSRTQITRLTEQVLSMTSVETAAITVTHTARVTTRLANNRIVAGDDGDDLILTVMAQTGERIQARMHTNQITQSTLQALVHQCETLARLQLVSKSEFRHVRQVQDAYLPVTLWHDPTVEAMTAPRSTAITTIVDRVTQHGLHAAGFIGAMARAQAVATKEGIFAFGEETDCEITITARTPDGKSSGWAGQAARDWSAIDGQNVAERAVAVARMNRDAQAIEPGRRTAILSSAAVAQLLRYFARELDAFATDQGQTGFSRTAHGGNKLRQRIFDPRIDMQSDPADSDGGYISYFDQGYATPKMTWIEAGVLQNLAYSVDYAMACGKVYATPPYSFRINGESRSLDALITSCHEGIYVNRLSAVNLLDQRTGMMSGVTRDGCFLIKNGKIDRPVKNFRFLDSPFFFLNKLVALGATMRAPFGYTPPAPGESDVTWPRPPVIVPPMMVEDFNFISLTDAV